MRMSKLEILHEYGYRSDPFGLMLETADYLKVSRVLGMAIRSPRYKIISIIGTRGMGKTWAVDQALGAMDIHRVDVERSNRERILIDDIERALIQGLSDETPKRMGEIRTKQMRRVVGEAVMKKPVVLVIEEAHRLHGQTLRSLKSLLEKDWMGKRNLFTVVLVGQSDPLRKQGVSETRLRSDSLNLFGLTEEEAAEFAKATVGRYFETDAIRCLARLKGARNYLELQEMLITLMGHALISGRKTVTILDVFEIYGGGLKELVKRLNLTYSDLEKETGIPRSTINLIANNKQGTLRDEKASEVKTAISEVIRRRMKGNDSQGLKVVGGE